MHGNMAAVQCLEVFSLCIVPLESLLFCSVLRWSELLKLEVHFDLHVAEMFHPSKISGVHFLIKHTSLGMFA